MDIWKANQKNWPPQERDFVVLSAILRGRFTQAINRPWISG